jgi:hypothetical protein
MAAVADTRGSGLLIPGWSESPDQRRAGKNDCDPMALGSLGSTTGATTSLQRQAAPASASSGNLR